MGNPDQQGAFLKLAKAGRKKLNKITYSETTRS